MGLMSFVTSDLNSVDCPTNGYGHQSKPEVNKFTYNTANTYTKTFTPTSFLL
jgi:hypothetical protein